MPIPERLVAIRTYDSPQLAEGDLAILAESGINGDIVSSFIRHRMRSELRVPETAVDEAMDLLPPELPTVSEELNQVGAPCAHCGGTGQHVTSPATRTVLIAGAVLALWALVNGRVNAAIITMFATLAVAAPIRVLTRHYRCDRCGRRWRRGDPDVRVFPTRH
jgi:hypothetical protein